MINRKYYPGLLTRWQRFPIAGFCSTNLDGKMATEGGEAAFQKLAIGLDLRFCLREAFLFNKLRAHG